MLFLSQCEINSGMLNMAKVIQTILLLVYVSSSMCAIIKGINDEPVGQKDLDFEKLYTGRWYVMFQKVACSWKGSEMFTDWQIEYYIDRQSGDLRGFGTWRVDGRCTTAPIRHRRTGESTVFIQDSLGDVISGKSVIVAADYIHFNIFWGCTKRNYDNKGCADAWVSVQCRSPVMTESVKQIVDDILERTFGLTTVNLMETTHNNACPNYYGPVRTE